MRTRLTDEHDAVATSLLAPASGNGSASRRRRPTPLKTTGTLTAIAPSEVDIAAIHTPPLRAVPGSVTARHALERTLQHLRPAPIGVIGLHASAVAEWLRRSGRIADAVATQRRPAQSKLAARSARHPVLVAVDCVEYAPDPAAFLREVRRMLASDGRLVVVIPNLTHASVRLAMLRGHNPLPVIGAPLAKHPLTAQDIERLLDDAGFAVTDIERELDSVEQLKDMGAGVPDGVLALLADDSDALTSHFVIIAAPHGASTTGHLHRRVRELINEQHAAARIADQLTRRIAQLESGNGDHAAATRTPANVVDAASGIERLDRELRAAIDRITARESADAEGDALLRQAREPLLASIREVTSLIARVEKSQYRRLVSRLCRIVNREVPSGSIVAVVSRGDHELLAFDRREGWHFPRTEDGVYAGHHPADGHAAIAHLEHLRARGARYLVIPRTSFWWLEHYRELADQLLRHHRCVFRDDRTCVVFALAKRGAPKLSLQRRRQRAR